MSYTDRAGSHDEPRDFYWDTCGSKKKKQLDKLTEEIGHRREEINHDAGIEHGGDTVGKERSVEFVSAQCDDFEAFKKYASKELKRLSSRLNVI